MTNPFHARVSLRRKKIDEMDGFAPHFVFSHPGGFPLAYIGYGLLSFSFSTLHDGLQFGRECTIPNSGLSLSFVFLALSLLIPPLSLLPFSAVNLSDHSAWIPGCCASFFLFYFISFSVCDSHLDQRWRSCCGAKKMGLRFYCPGMLFIISIPRPCQYQGNECYYILHVPLR